MTRRDENPRPLTLPGEIVVPGMLRVNEFTLAAHRDSVKGFTHVEALRAGYSPEEIVREYGKSIFSPGAAPSSAMMTMPPPAKQPIVAIPAAQVAVVAIPARDFARLQGYTGDACPQCQLFTMTRNGSCLVCNSCGATTGCS